MSANQIQVVRILNPFDPRERVLESIDWEPAKTLADYFPYSPLHTNEVVVSVSGKVVMPEQFGVTHLTKEDSLVICPVPLGGGGGGKSILRIVAMIAIAVYAPGMLVQYGGATMGATVAGATTLTATGGLVMAGITIAGSMLVNALLPIKPVQKDAGTNNNFDSSPSYGVDGAKNSAAEGIPVPVCYGTFRMGGNLANFFIENVGNTQVLYMLFVAGEGPIANITDIQLNDQPITNFSNYEVITKVGGDEQTVIPWFNDLVEPHSINLITTDSGYVNYTTSQEVDKFRVDLVAPAGLFTIDPATGASSALAVDFIIEYRKQGDAAWTQLTDTNGVIGYQTVTECETITEEVPGDE